MSDEDAPESIPAPQRDSLGTEGPLLRIGELARRAGVPTATLRAWERRYGIVVPTRGESGYRLYSVADERRVRAMLDLMAQGLAPAEAARLASGAGEEAGVGEEEGTGAAGMRGGLADSLLALDAPGAERMLDRALAAYSLHAVLEDLIMPVLRRIGDGWAGEEVTIGQEHFASNVLRGRLLGLARGWGGGEGPLALLGCPSGELHDLGLIAFGLTLRNRGWRIAFFGADTPVETLTVAADETAPAAVVLHALTPEPFSGIEPVLAQLGTIAPLHLAGLGASEALCSAVGATLLEQGPVAAAAALA